MAEALDLYASFYGHPADRRSCSRAGARGEETAVRESFRRSEAAASPSRGPDGSPEIAFLDELTTGLDPQARQRGAPSRQIRDNGVTVVLVTHFMEEAERLCDRVMVVAGGRLTALDTPAGLVEQMGAIHRIRFRPSAGIEDAELLALPGVDFVQHSGLHIEIVGSGDVVHAVTVLLARRQIIAHELRIEQYTSKTHTSP